MGWNRVLDRPYHGGIWGGLFTPTEAGGVGLIGAVILGILKGMRWRDLVGTVIDVAGAVAPIMFLLLTANMYAKFMETAGMSEMISKHSRPISSVRSVSFW